MELDNLLRDLDGPRPLPSGVRDRLEETLVDGPGAAESVVALRGADAPREIPTDVRDRLEAALAPPSGRRLPRAVLAVATAVAVIAAALVVVRTGNEDSPAASPEPPVAAPAEPIDRFAPPTPTPGTGPVDPRGTSRLPQEGSLAAPAEVEHPPPPHAFRRPTPAVVGPAGGPPLSVGMVAGADGQVAGFRAYVEALNAAGGVRGRAVRVVEASPESLPEDAVATVNLSGEPIAAPDGPRAWSRGPLLEGPSAPEDVLHGSVFGLASPPERQAHLLADAVFPEASPGSVAAIYRATEGVFAERVPDALREVLEARGVTVVETTYEEDSPAPYLPADAAFLSLPKEDARRFIDYAQGVGYRPSRGMGCLFPMLDPGIADELGEGYLVLAPYSLGHDDERRALEERIGRPANTDAIHGWTTAKALAVALWRSGADTREGTREALSELGGYDPGFAPELAFRDGTHARTPEGILYEVRDGAFAPQGGFRTDPR